MQHLTVAPSHVYTYLVFVKRIVGGPHSAFTVHNVVIKATVDTANHTIAYNIRQHRKALQQPFNKHSTVFDKHSTGWRKCATITQHVCVTNFDAVDTDFFSVKICTLFIVF